MPELTDKVDDPEPATEVGLNEALAPGGNPETLRFTESLNPFVAVEVTV